MSHGSSHHDVRLEGPNGARVCGVALTDIAADGQVLQDETLIGVDGNGKKSRDLCSNYGDETKRKKETPKNHPRVTIKNADGSNNKKTCRHLEDDG